MSIAKRCNYFLLLPVLLVLGYGKAAAQARIILNGADITITNSAYLVIDNNATNAITRVDGEIISEGANNILKWNIGTATGSYTIPFGYGTSSYVPLSFVKTAGSGNGYFLFSTYRTGWQNSLSLPSGVTGMSGASGNDHSAFVIDRFWSLDAQGYTAKPSLSNLLFTYLEDEHTVLSNTILESGLKPQRWNGSAWIVDNSYTQSTSGNTMSVTSVASGDLHKWWTLATMGTTRYWTSSAASSSNVASNWITPLNETGVPASVDHVIFRAANVGNCLLADNLDAFTFTVEQGYTGTITQGDKSIVVNNNATFSGGTFTGGTGSITVGNDLTIAGSNFTAPAGVLDLKGDLSIASGTFAHNNGTVQFSGVSSETQAISGAVSATFNNIRVENSTASPGVSLETNKSIKGTLTLASNSSFDADGSAGTSVFRLLSSSDNPTNDASIAALPSGAQVQGKITVQRFMSLEGLNNKIYRYIASPVEAGSVADLQGEIPVTGPFTGRSTCSGCTSTSPSLYAYNEAVAGAMDNGYTRFPVSANTETFTNGRGYALYVRGNLLSSAMWDIRGTVVHANVTPVSFPLTYTSSGASDDGWNLIGNPFPSTIDWNSTEWTKQNIEGSIYITDNGGVSTRMASWNGVVGTNGGSRYIASGQAFWVKAKSTGGAALQATENVKAAGTQSIFFREEAPANLIRVTLSRDRDNDEAVIHFREDATEHFDVDADARKMKNASFNLSSLQRDGLSLSINSQPSLGCRSSIPLNVEGTAAGTYVLKFSQYESFPEGYSIVLIDNYEKRAVSVKDGSYEFKVNADGASFGSSRFIIDFSSPTPQPSFNIVSKTSVCRDEAVQILLDNAQKGITYQAFSGDGAVSSPVMATANSLTIDVPSAGLPAGPNMITVRATSPACDAVVEKIVLIQIEQAYTPVVIGGEVCRQGRVTLTASGAPVNGGYNWYSAETGEALDVHSATFLTPELRKTSTYFVSISTSSQCEGIRVPVKAVVNDYPFATITEADGYLYSNSAGANQWYFNDNIIAGATHFNVKMTDQGKYTLRVGDATCFSTADFLFVVNTIAGVAVTRIVVSPNPFSSEANVEIPDTYGIIKSITLINQLGQSVYDVPLTTAEGNKSRKIISGSMAPGIYVLQVVGTNGYGTLKIVKE